MPKSVIAKAHQLLRRRKFSQVIRLLESQIFRFRNNAEFYSLLGSACLYTGDLGGAESYLQRSEQLNPEDAVPRLGLAAVAYKRGNIEEAIKSWLEIIDREPGNRQALRALGVVRKQASREGSPFPSDTLDIRLLLPPLPPSPWIWLAPVLSVVLLAAVLSGYHFLLPLLQRSRVERPGVEDIELSADRPLVASQPPQSVGAGGAYEPETAFTLTDRQIEETFQSIKRYLLDYRDNLAIREINRLLHSNASAYVKEKARLMRTFVQEPDFATIRDPFPYTEVRREPILYSDTFVMWRGKAANLRIGAEEIAFDLLVGYQDEKELLGMVPVVLRFAANLENGDGVEVLGRVQVREGQIRLEGISIHRLYRSP
jgi:tetratricopeptide (TPR) repeat protein